MSADFFNTDFYMVVGFAFALGFFSWFLGYALRLVFRLLHRILGKA